MEEILVTQMLLAEGWKAPERKAYGTFNKRSKNINIQNTSKDLIKTMNLLIKFKR